MPSQTVVASCKQDKPKPKNGSSKNKGFVGAKLKKEAILKKLQ